ncbi:hypothetical protein HOD61_01345 [archaeon]|jgi:hypothetical protein|nr:hypothetical protein [archaeon]
MKWKEIGLYGSMILATTVLVYSIKHCEGPHQILGPELNYEEQVDSLEYYDIKSDSLETKILE